MKRILHPPRETSVSIIIVESARALSSLALELVAWLQEVLCRLGPVVGRMDHGTARAEHQCQCGNQLQTISHFSCLFCTSFPSPALSITVQTFLCSPRHCRTRRAANPKKYFLFKQIIYICQTNPNQFLQWNRLAAVNFIYLPFICANNKLWQGALYTIWSFKISGI